MKIKNFRKYLTKLKNPVNVADKAITILGIAFIFIGIYQIYSPAAWIVLGLIFAWPGLPNRKEGR